MEKITNKYETIFVVDTSIGEEAVNSVVEKFKTMIANSCSVESVDEWGKRKLAYEIQKMKEGYYYFIQFEAVSDCPAEVEQRVRIMENVIRYLCVKQEA